MANLIKCKACGYVTQEGKIKNVCPACGVPAKMFEPYTDPVSENRRNILGMHIHPVIVHFPQAFASTLFILSALSFFAPAPIQKGFYYTMQVISFLMLFFVVLSIFTGLFDGKIRFRKVTTPFLKTKMMIGGVFLLTSVALTAVAFSETFPAPPMHALFTLLAIIAVSCTIPLGFIGARLSEAKFPG